MTGDPPKSTIDYFTLAFYNKDNLGPPPNYTPKPIWFTGSTQYGRICYAATGGTDCTISTDKKSATFTIYYDELNHPDLNWGGNYPTDIQVNGYFRLSDGGVSRADGKKVSLLVHLAATLL
ncbi:MAG: hypothetical protein NTZ93_04765 [Candidatus Beckwithbacteria bacterium]|nr:hypothetical protein [Candidatus Beckwithbacteria bacterium]